MIEWLTYWLENKNSYIIYLLVLYFVGQCLDMVLGVIIAKIDPTVKFSSSKWKFGIIVKLAQFGLLIYMLPVFLIFGESGLVVYTTMLVSIIGSELYSILGHLKIVDDGKKGLFEVIQSALDRLFKRGDG